MEKNDVLVVTKLDRLGRDAIDVSITVNKLEKIGNDTPRSRAARY
ncbi:MAG: recombinase family protein, partial [Rickettsia endosymbiont of Ixodes persulcatus]|nr:recombinase family protein [Rickettsia endosymbiont of Ixodes persulcatus]